MPTHAGPSCVPGPPLRVRVLAPKPEGRRRIRTAREGQAEGIPGGEHRPEREIADVGCMKPKAECTIAPRLRKRCIALHSMHPTTMFEIAHEVLPHGVGKVDRKRSLRDGRGCLPEAGGCCSRGNLLAARSVCFAAGPLRLAAPPRSTSPTAWWRTSHAEHAASNAAEANSC